MAKKRNFKNRRQSADRREETSNRNPRGRHDEGEYREARNDVSWYSKYPNLLIAAGSFPFPYRPGMKLPLGQLTIDGLTGSVERGITIPGVMTLDWMPSVGVSNVATDPASIMAKEIYAQVRSKFSGSLDADAPDFVVYLMALDSIFSYLAWLKRVFRVMNAWTPENYALPDTVLGAMGLSKQTILNLRQNRMDFWQSINELVLQSRKFTCPAVMDIFNRHYWMSDNVYTDENSINSQFYLFNLRAVYKYAALPVGDGSGNTGAGLQMVVMPTFATPGSGNNLMPADFYNFGRDLIDALVAWDDAYTINGYLLKAFEGAPNFIVDELPVDQPFTPVYVEEVLAQIENSRAVPRLARATTNLGGFNITQNPLTNAIISNPSYTATAGQNDPFGVLKYNGWNVPPILSIRSDTPTVADNTIASRLQACVDVVAGSSADTYDVTVYCGTEVPCGWYLYTKEPTLGGQYDGGSYEQAITLFIDTDGTPDIVDVNNMIVNLVTYLGVEQFDWHPFMFMSTARSSSGRILGSSTIVGDTHNITTIQASDLRNLHKICIYSELNAFSI